MFKARVCALDAFSAALVKTAIGHDFEREDGH